MKAVASASAAEGGGGALTQSLSVFSRVLQNRKVSGDQASAKLMLMRNHASEGERVCAFQHPPGCSLLNTNGSSTEFTMQLLGGD